MLSKVSCAKVGSLFPNKGIVEFQPFHPFLQGSNSYPLENMQFAIENGNL